jgi:hypothetical protein
LLITTDVLMAGFFHEFRPGFAEQAWPKLDSISIIAAVPEGLRQ